jgi:hypothetical protein
MKIQLDISYSVWKQVAQANSWVTYYSDGGSTRAFLWTGDRDHIYQSQADGADFTDWTNTFQSAATEVQKDDDALALIVGLSNVKPAPVDSDGTPITTMEKRQADQVPVFAFAPRVGDEEIIATHNYADRCSWFRESTRITDETMTVDSGDATGKTYESAHEWWIDMLTGRLLNEATWIDLESHGYQVVVKDNGVEQTIRPFPTCPGTFDCEIFYHLGKVVFLNGVPTGPVTVSYSYAGTSGFYLEPDEGKTLKIEKGEADFSVGDVDGNYRVVFTTEIDYGIWGYAWYYAPQYPQVRAHAAGNVTLSGDQTIDDVILVDGDQVACVNQTTSTEDGMYIVDTSGPWIRSPYFPAGLEVSGYLYFPTEGTTYGRVGLVVANPPPNDVVGTDDLVVVTYFTKNARVSLKTDRYKRAMQIIMEARGAHPVIVAVGATTQQLADLKDGTIDLDEFRRQARGFVSNMQPVPFPYDTVRELESSKGHQLRVSTLGNLVMGGESVTLTFYCTSWDKVS